MDLKLLLFGDASGALRRVIAYRPVLNTITGSPNATLFLMQVCYWWFSSGCRPFYKFNAPCDHELCRPGDTWQEELEMGRTAFENARAAVATKVTRGTSKLAVRETALIIYWTDSERRTWYEVNESLLWQMLVAALKLDEEARSLTTQKAVDNAGQRRETMHYLEAPQTRKTLSSKKTTRNGTGYKRHSRSLRRDRQIVDAAEVLQEPIEEEAGRAQDGTPQWWQAALRELQGQMTRATYERLLLGSQARYVSAGALEVSVKDESAAIHLQRLTERVRCAVAVASGEAVYGIEFVPQ
jgi:hypothetical protein